MMPSSEYLFLESDYSFTKYVSSCPYTIFVSTVIVFVNEGVSDKTIESVFQFLVRHSNIKRGKFERLDACYMVENWRFKMPFLF